MKEDVHGVGATEEDADDLPCRPLKGTAKEEEAPIHHHRQWIGYKTIQTDCNTVLQLHVKEFYKVLFRNYSHVHNLYIRMFKSNCTVV